MGKHRKPSRHAASTAAVVGGVTVSALVFAGTASAAPPGGWGPIVTCESGNNPRAQNPHSTASGLYGFLDSTWASLGGTGHAKDASVAVQTAMADKLYASAGTRPWTASQACWAGKTTVHTPHATVHARTSGRHASHREAPRHATPQHPRHSVTVTSGDTLSGIAATHGENWPALYARNRAVVGANPDRIFPGQTLAL